MLKWLKAVPQPTSLKPCGGLLHHQVTKSTLQITPAFVLSNLTNLIDNKAEVIVTQYGLRNQGCN